MKRSILIVISCFALLAMQADKLPPVNAKMIACVDKMMGKKVDRGECWDLVNYALNNSDANWDSPEGFGKKVDPKKDVLFPGDVVVMKNVKYTSSDGARWNFPQHYAIIYKVKDKNSFTIANQNVSGKRSVILTELTLTGLTGTISFFRPQPK